MPQRRMVTDEGRGRSSEGRKNGTGDVQPGTLNAIEEGFLDFPREILDLPLIYSPRLSARTVRH